MGGTSPYAALGARLLRQHHGLLRWIPVLYPSPSCDIFSLSPPPPGDRWLPQTAKQGGDRISKQFLCSIWKKRNERPNVGVVSIRSRNGAPSRKGCVVDGQITKASNN